MSETKTNERTRVNSDCSVCMNSSIIREALRTESETSQRTITSGRSGRRARNCGTIGTPPQVRFLRSVRRTLSAPFRRERCLRMSRVFSFSASLRTAVWACSISARERVWNARSFRGPPRCGAGRSISGVHLAAGGVLDLAEQPGEVLARRPPARPRESPRAFSSCSIAPRSLARLLAPGAGEHPPGEEAGLERGLHPREVELQGRRPEQLREPRRGRPGAARPRAARAAARAARACRAAS